VEEDAAIPLPSVAEAVDSSTGFFAAAFDLMAQDHTTPGSSRGTSIVSSARESPRMQSFALASGFKPAYAEDSLCPIEKEPKRRPPPLSLHTEASKPEVSLPLAASDRFEDTFPPEGQVKKITPQLQDWQKELTISSPPPRPSLVNTPTLFSTPPATVVTAPRLGMRSRASSLAMIHEASRLHTLTLADFSLPGDSRESRRRSMFGAAPQENKRKSLRRPIVVSEVSAPIM
jgi:acetyl esterase/lipase